MGLLCLPRFKVEAVFFLVAGSTTGTTLCSTFRPGMLVRVAPSTKKGKRAIIMEVITLAVVVIACHDDFDAGLEVMWGI